jgi:hypothetical protein
LYPDNQLTANLLPCFLCVLQRAEAAATAARLAKLQGKPLQEGGGSGRAQPRQQQQLAVPPEQVGLDYDSSVVMILLKFLLHCISVGLQTL